MICRLFIRGLFLATLCPARGQVNSQSVPQKQSRCIYKSMAIGFSVVRVVVGGLLWSQIEVLNRVEREWRGSWSWIVLVGSGVASCAEQSN